MAALDAVNERLHFSERLRQSLDQAGQAPDSPTALARFFNCRYDGEPVTVHAVRKWLIGEAIPTQEKLRVLAQWLEVPADWLRYGANKVGDSSPQSSPQSAYSRYGKKDQAILESIRKLDDAHQEAVLALIQSLVRATREDARKHVR